MKMKADFISDVFLCKKTTTTPPPPPSPSPPPNDAGGVNGSHLMRRDRPLMAGLPSRRGGSSCSSYTYRAAAVSLTDHLPPNLTSHGWWRQRSLRHHTRWKTGKTQLLFTQEPSATPLNHLFSFRGDGAMGGGGSS